MDMDDNLHFGLACQQAWVNEIQGVNIFSV